MSQFAFDADGEDSGDDLVSKLDSMWGALISSHKGSSAPSYPTAGLAWIDDSSSPWALKRYDGTDWIVEGYIDASGNLYVLSDATRFAAAGALTKRFHFVASGITGGQDRAITLPDADLNLSGLGTQAEGDVLYRGASAWQRLPKGSAGQKLRQNAGLTAPEWETGWETIFNGDLSAASGHTFNNLSPYIFLDWNAFLVPSTDGASITMRVSTDNGSTFDTGSNYHSPSLYVALGAPTTPAAFYTTSTSFSVGASSLDNVNGVHMRGSLMSFNKAREAAGPVDIMHRSSDLANFFTIRGGFVHLGTTARDAIIFLVSSGNLSGHILLRGKRG